MYPFCNKLTLFVCNNSLPKGARDPSVASETDWLRARARSYYKWPFS